MSRSAGRFVGGCVLAACSVLGIGHHQAAVGQVATAASIDDLARLGPDQLLALYARSAPGPIPVGRLRGRALVRPGSALARPATRASGLLWQGKVFNPKDASVVNRWAGVRAVRAEGVGYGPSWQDGGSAIVIDYQGTSRVYANVRDELRLVAPGLYLGLMYDKSSPRPTLRRFFALEAY